MGSKPTISPSCKISVKCELLVGDNLPNDLTWESDLLYKAMSHDPIAIKYISGKLE